MNKKQITDLISSYEKRQFNEIVKWEDAVPGVVAQSLNFVMKPVSLVVQKVIPQKAIRGALVFSNWFAECMTDSKDIIRDGGVRNIKELGHKDLELSDRLANEVHNWANAIATTEGGLQAFLELLEW